MNKRKLLPLAALCALVVLLGIALAVLTLSEEEPEPDTTIPLCTLDTAAIDGLSYQEGELSVTLTLDEEGNWTLESDPALPLDQTTVQNLVDNVAGLAALRALEGADQDGMGFDEPAMLLTLAAGEDTLAYTVGALNEMTGAYYLRTAEDGPVYTVSESDLSSLCKTPRQLYAAQTVTDWQTDALATMTVDNGTELLEFVQTDGVWTLADDPDYTLDQDLVNKMANTICALQTKWTITAPGAQADYGLDAPDVTVTLQNTDGETLLVRFGATLPEDDTVCYLAADNADGVVYEVASANLSAYAYTKQTLAGTEQTPETADVIAENFVGGADDFAN